MKIEGVLETCLYVNDLGAAEEFYANILGLPIFSREGNRHVFFRCGEAMFLLFNPDETIQSDEIVPRHGARGQGHVAFAVPEASLGGWREHFQQHGVEIEEEVAWPNGGRSLYVRDPAGNSVELATRQIWNLTGG